MEINIMPVIFIFGWILVYSVTSFDTAIDGELNHLVCPSETFKAVCEVDEVIIITKAQYGRMQINRCKTQDFGHRCSENVTSEMHGYCSGRHNCDLKVLDEAFPDTPSCHADLKSYLDVSFTCLKVATPPLMNCNRQAVILQEGQGHISNIVSEETSCGTSDSPWEIRAASGKRIKITLIDFTSNSQHARNGRININSKVCRVYATLKEPGISRPQTVCGSESHDRHVYTSSSNSLQVIILDTQPTRQQRLHFLLHYQVIGCEKVTPPTDGWVRENDVVALIGCDVTPGVTWKLTCKDGVWHGDRPNCTKESGSALTTQGDYTGSMSLPIGIIIVIILGLALVIGLLVLVIGLWLWGRPGSHRNDRSRGHHVTQQVHESTGHVTYHELGPKHYIRHCDYEPCPVMSQCMVHPTLRSQQGSAGKEQDYGAVHLLRTTPDVITCDESDIYNQASRLAAQNESNESTQQQQMQCPTHDVIIEHDRIPTASENNAHNEISSNGNNNGNAKIETSSLSGDLLLSPKLNRTQDLNASLKRCKLPADSVKSQRTLAQDIYGVNMPSVSRAQSDIIDIKRTVLPMHSFACMQNSQKTPNYACKCPPGSLNMQTFKPITS